MAEREYQKALADYGELIRLQPENSQLDRERSDLYKTIGNPICTANLKALDEAERKWAAENGKKAGDTPYAIHIIAYLREGKLPVCPDGGSYELPPVGQKPRCSVHGGLP